MLRRNKSRINRNMHGHSYPIQNCRWWTGHAKTNQITLESSLALIQCKY